MVSTSGIDHIEMGWIRKKPREFLFPEGFEVENFNGSFEQKEAFYLIWHEKPSSESEINEAFSKNFETYPDCIPQTDTFFVKYKNQYVGTITAIWHKKENVGHLHYVAIKKEFRNRRLSYPLMYVAMEKLYKNGCKTVFLRTDDWRICAIKCYLNMGFLPKMPPKNSGKQAAHIKRWKSIYKTLNISTLKMYNKDYNIVVK